MLYKNNSDNSPFTNLLHVVIMRRNRCCKDVTDKDNEDAAKD